MQTATWSHFSIEENIVKLKIPPLHTTQINQYPKSTYLQCISLKVNPYTKTNAPVARALRQAELEKEFGKYYMEFRCLSKNNHKVVGERHVRKFVMPTSELKLEAYLEKFNEMARTNTTNMYARVPLFLEWVPKLALNPNLRLPPDMTDYFQEFAHDYSVSDQYPEDQVPPLANRYKLPPNTDKSTIAIRIWVAPNTRLLWTGLSGLAKLGFDIKNSAYVHAVTTKDKKIKKKMDFSNPSSSVYDILETPNSPHNAIPVNTETSVQIRLNIDVDQVYEVEYNPNEEQDIAYAFKLLKQTLDKVRMDTNVPLDLALEEPEGDRGGFYSLRVKCTPRLEMEFKLSPTLANELNIYNATITSTDPLWMTEFFKPGEQSPTPSSDGDADTLDPGDGGEDINNPGDEEGDNPEDEDNTGDEDEDTDNDGDEDEDNDNKPTPPPASGGDIKPTPSNPPGGGKVKPAPTGPGAPGGQGVPSGPPPGGSGVPSGSGGKKRPGPPAPPSQKKTYEPMYVPYPMTGTEKLAAYVRKVGNLYGCVMGLQQDHFPGKLFFVLRPNRDAWELFDSPHLMQPFILTKKDLETLNENPIKIGLYYHNSPGRFALLGAFANYIEGLFYWRSD